MTAFLVLSRDAKSFIHKCAHCSHERRESVDPTRNPYPFNFITHCSACSQPINIDHQFIRDVQSSFLRATNAGKKMPDVSGVESVGREGGEIKITGSPAYSACETIRADADAKRVDLPLMLRFEGSLSTLL